MPFKFSSLCELLEELSRNRYQQRATNWRQQRPDHRLVREWYNTYNDKIDRSGPAAVAFLSALFPERRPDRTYNLQEKRLSHIFGNALGLGTARLRDLLSWQRTDGQDFPTCVQRIMSECEFDHPVAGNEVTLQEIDEALTLIAANTISSAPVIRSRANGQAPVDILRPIIQRLQSHEAKWLVRMIQKSYSPVELSEYVALHEFHFMLPKLLEVQNCFATAIETLSKPELSNFRILPCEEETRFVALMARHINPQLGIMVRRQPFYKARSIKHCVKMAESRIMSVERKHDGEYCQVHIDISKGSQCIQIFSKNGRDSTEDRFALQDAVKAGLRLGQPDCKIKSRAILEGELLVYSNSQKAILPFYHIRKHVRHGGRRIGTEKDSPKKVDESLMIVFYDVLLLDEKVLLAEAHKNRRAHLKALITPIEGYAEIVERAMIDFGSRHAAEVLRNAFGSAIRKRWEGFVLKGLEDPYFTWRHGTQSIKLKKDYISGLGDSADLCIIGGRREPSIETELGLGRLSWTAFYVAAVVNKDDVRRYNTRPVFKILDRLGPGSLSKEDILALNSEGQLVKQDYVAESTFMVLQHPRATVPLPSHTFTRPIVVEVMGAGYERPQSANFWVLRFPRRVGSKIKLHKDRDVADSVSFSELQDMAEESMKTPEDAASQEDAKWVERLLAADPKPVYHIDKSQSTSPAKTLRSETTADLTPVGRRGSSTRRTPIFIRMDSTELTTGELVGHDIGGYPDFRTPSRHSDLTVTPSASDQSRISKHDFAPIDDSPSPNTSRKRQCIRTKDIVRGIRSQPLSPLASAPNQLLIDANRSRHGEATILADSGSYVPEPGQNGLKEKRVHVSTIRPTKTHNPRFHSALIPAISVLPPQPSKADYAQHLDRGLVSKGTACVGRTRSCKSGKDDRSAATALNTTATPHPSSLRSGPTLIRPLSQFNEHNVRLVLEASEKSPGIYTRSIETFAKQFAVQLQTPGKDRLHCAALIDSSTPETAASNIQMLAKGLVRSRAIATNIESDASISVYDFNVLKTASTRSERDSALKRSDVENRDYLIGILKVSKENAAFSRRTLKLKMTWNIRAREFKKSSCYRQTDAMLEVLG
ncbi:hypothetical protein H2198_001811 [Neophaeococcomyces mojaviensis]|uniref:Uncharacterized protein n=1 Tax=Neophaeococcomyces mojaviensis TaxID=3383035 RepID=A0ACC3AFT9_9EURO|nr:hypothetical protein H2198_001811 [Knufia sp. JES_112]